MLFKPGIFRKIVMLLILLLVPIMLMYTVSYRISTNVVQKELRTSNLDQLSFFLHQIDSNIQQLAMFPTIMSNDPYIREFINPPESLDLLNAQSRLSQKLSLQSVANSWSNKVTVLIPPQKRFVSSDIFLTQEDRMFTGPMYKRWTYLQESSIYSGQSYFLQEIGDPVNESMRERTDTVFQVQFSSENITNMLDVYKRGHNNNPLLFHPKYDPILNSTASRPLVQQVLLNLRSEELGATGQKVMTLDSRSYLVSYAQSKQLDWYLVDYVPVQDILAPIRTSCNYFYLFIGVLLILGVISSFWLYRNVQIPVSELMQGVNRIKRGDFSARVQYRANNEFDFVIHHFNQMTEQIQILIEDVYAEKLRSREATLKQLQSQINPHFLYNSLFFIINSALMDDRDSVVQMSQNLASFFRYATRLENQTATVREELDMVQHYLVIQNLRNERLQFEIDVPAEMMDLEIPRLILQPIVENALVHGIDRSEHNGFIRIEGESDEDHHRLIVEDNGAGITAEQIKALHRRLSLPMSEEIGTGTWNVNRRLQYLFGEGSGLTFEQAPGGRTRAILTWNRNKP